MPEIMWESHYGNKSGIQLIRMSVGCEFSGNAWEKGGFII